MEPTGDMIQLFRLAYEDVSKADVHFEARMLEEFLNNDIWETGRKTNYG